MKKKILHITGIIGIGGVEKMVIQLCNNLNKDLFNVAIFSYSIDVNITKELNNDVKLISLGYKTKDIAGWKFIIHLFPIIGKIIKMIRNEKPDIIHIHTTASRYLIFSLISLLFFRNIIFIKTVHTSGYFLNSKTISDKIRLFIERLAIRIRPTHIVGISKQVYDINQCIFTNIVKSYSLIYNGIDINAFNKSIEEKKKDSNIINVAYVARVVPGKNHLFLIHLWKKIINNNTNIRLLFIGDGILLNTIKVEIKKYNLEKNILCLGGCNNVAQILNNCDFAVFPSEFEGFGISLIEKMASKLPVIASDIPPFREIISDQKDGFIIDTKNENEWIKTINILSTNQSLRIKIGEAAYEKSKKYSLDKMVEKYENLYLNV